jgi:Bacteriophage holin family
MKYLKYFGLSLIAIFAPIKHLLIATAIMIFVDLITGILAARKRGEPITSAGIRRSLSKLIVYEAAILIAFMTEHYMSDTLPFVNMASSMISLVEITSVYENINSLSGTDLLKGLISKLGSNKDN